MDQKHTVLLIDDDKFLLEMYRKKFEPRVGKVELAVGADDALAKLRGGFSPDIIVVDVIMPCTDGIEFLEKVRSEKLVPNAALIVLSNESDRAKIDKAKTLGIKGYIVKATSVPTEVVDEVLKIANMSSKK